MAQLTYRGNLSAKVFPFLSTQFGRTVIMGGNDHAGGVPGDNNLPQAYYMHNVMPTAQGYQSVGYADILAESANDFDRLIPVRDPDMTQGWLGITTYGGLFIYRVGDISWTPITLANHEWQNTPVSVAYANGYTYICLPGLGVYKVDVANKTINVVTLNGLVGTKIVAITASANYMIVTDGTTIYWSSTITPEDFVPSLITGAGSGKPEDAEGVIVALVPISTGFAAYTSVNVVLASYSQNPRFPWIFRGADNSKGVADVQHITYSGDDGTNYAWTSAGLQKITVTGATVFLPEASDFLAGQEFEDWDNNTNSLVTQFTSRPFKIKLAFIAGRYLVLSYGISSLTHALIYDTALGRWGKIKVDHVACFGISLNTDGQYTTSTSASNRKTIGIVTAKGGVKSCSFVGNAKATDSVLVLGKFQLLRSRLVTLQSVSVESVDPNGAGDFSLQINTTMDGKNPEIVTTPTLKESNYRYKEYVSRVTGLNHSLVLKGTFSLNSFELAMTLNGRR